MLEIVRVQEREKEKPKNSIFVQTDIVPELSVSKQPSRPPSTLQVFKEQTNFEMPAAKLGSRSPSTLATLDLPAPPSSLNRTETTPAPIENITVPEEPNKPKDRAQMLEEFLEIYSERDQLLEAQTNVQATQTRLQSDAQTAQSLREEIIQIKSELQQVALQQLMAASSASPGTVQHYAQQIAVLREDMEAKRAKFQEITSRITKTKRELEYLKATFQSVRGKMQASFRSWMRKQGSTYDASDAFPKQAWNDTIVMNGKEQNDTRSSPERRYGGLAQLSYQPERRTQSRTKVRIPDLDSLPQDIAEDARAFFEAKARKSTRTPSIY